MRTATTLAAGAGGVLWAMATAFAVLLAPTPPNHRGVTRACAEAAASIVAALIGGWFVAPAICLHMHITEDRDRPPGRPLRRARVLASGGVPQVDGGIAMMITAGCEGRRRPAPHPL